MQSKITAYFCKNHFNIILPSTPTASDFCKKFYMYHFLYASYWLPSFLWQYPKRHESLEIYQMDCNCLFTKSGRKVFPDDIQTANIPLRTVIKHCHTNVARMQFLSAVLCMGQASPDVRQCR